ncbi:MAG: hypothetical protein EOO54_10720 [Haliea sp.]|nr:MAG: hypothetical protein EOO54_10720 [Haliea sp.]
MEHLVAGTRLADLVILLTVLEAFVLVLYRWSTARGLAPHEFLLNMVSGLCLMLALRSALADQGWPWQAGWLLAAGLAHWADLWRRWLRPS